MRCSVLGVTVLLLLAIIVSQQLWLWTVIRPDTASDTLVLYALSTLNFVAFVVFLFIFVRNLLKLRSGKERQLGSKVKTRLLVYFISISFLPITAMAVFSYLFLNRSLEKWFNPLPEEILQQAQQVRGRRSRVTNKRCATTHRCWSCCLTSKPRRTVRRRWTRSSHPGNWRVSRSSDLMEQHWPKAVRVRPPATMS